MKSILPDRLGWKSRPFSSKQGGHGDSLLDHGMGASLRAVLVVLTTTLLVMLQATLYDVLGPLLLQDRMHCLGILQNVLGI